MAEYAPDALLYPLSFAECNIENGPPQIKPEDIESYAYPPGYRRRYTNSGWDKALALGIAQLTPEDFGALPDGFFMRPAEGKSGG